MKNTFTGTLKVLLGILAFVAIAIFAGTARINKTKSILLVDGGSAFSSG